MATGRRSSKTPIPVRRALRKLGSDIRDARRRRRIPVAIMAERASISRTTLNKVEKGDEGVSMGIYATVLFVLGFVARIGDLADHGRDEVGLALEEEHLPQRIRRPRKPRSGPAAELSAGEEQLPRSDQVEIR
jgi:DNA-binding XRE family transcriptional regulator